MYSLAALHEFPDSGACFPVAGRRCSTTYVIPACLLQAGESPPAWMQVVERRREQAAEESSGLYNTFP